MNSSDCQRKNIKKIPVRNYSEENERKSAKYQYVIRHDIR